MEVDDARQAPVRAKHEDAGCMVHRIVAIIARNAAVGHIERLRGMGNLIRRAGQAGDARIEIRQIVGQHCRAVAFGIDREQMNGKPVGIGAKILQPVADVQERHRADVGAPGEAEKDEARCANPVLGTDGFAFMAGELP